MLVKHFLVKEMAMFEDEGSEAIDEELWITNFTILVKDIKPQIQETLQISSKINTTPPKKNCYLTTL